MAENWIVSVVEAERVRRREMEVADDGGSLEEVTEWGWLVHGLVSSANPCKASEVAVDAGRV